MGDDKHDQSSAGSLISQYYSDKQPSDKIVNQEEEMSCVAAVCRQAIIDMTAVDIQEAVVREAIGTNDRTGTEFGSSVLRSGLDALIKNHNLENIKFISGFDMRIDTALTVEAKLQIAKAHIEVNRIAIFELRNVGGHAVIVDKIESTLVFVRDPWGIDGPGSGKGMEATMTLERFTQFWTGGIIVGR